MSTSIYSPFSLPNGSILPNRIAKAAMEENLAEPGHLPGTQLFSLYKAWAEGGAGLMITGNVMIDHLAMTGPGGVALEEDTPLAPFRQWAESAQGYGGQLWMQISHPGRQVYAALGGKALCPSDVAVDIGKHSSLFSQPTIMSETEIQDVIQRFATTARRAEEAGFSGIQIHGAHGYLVSQFLSPLTNKRKDRWGGSLKNRSRLLVETVKAIRSVISKKTSLAVKLNSADFQRGGFDIDDAFAVVEALNTLGVDLVELSGGSYETPVMFGRAADDRTLAREAYFLEFAKDIAKVATMPVMTTGGIRRKPVAEEVLNNGVDIVGMGTALAFEPTLPNIWRNDPQFEPPNPQVNWKNKPIASLAKLAVVRRQLIRMGKGKLPKPSSSPVFSLIADRIRFKKLTKRYRVQNASEVN